MNLPYNLRELRKQHNYKQTDLSKILSVSQQTISSFENGETEPSIDLLIKLSQHFNVTVDFLLGLTDVPAYVNIDTLSNNEHNLIIKYRTLNDNNKIRVSERTETLLSIQK